ncbi:MAG: hypothetical protein J6M23_05250 [Bacteroidales bacterium]|nr:hypothetical protein [Bacteroidales bacterium]
MPYMTVTHNALCAISTLCEFVFSHSETIPPDITAMIFGISPSVVTVRHNGASLPGEGLPEDLSALFVRLKEYGVLTLSFTGFSGGVASRREYRFSESGEISSSFKESADSAQDGALFRLSLAEGKDAEKKSVSAIWESLAALLEKMENPPVLSHVSLFMNGERIN